MSQDRILKLEKLVQDMALKISELENPEGRKLQNSFDTGDTAWLLASTALVLFMTIPGLALYYGGMARAKNVLAIVVQCVTITALITVLWLFFGYSLAFSPVDENDDHYPIYGNTSRFWLSGLGLNTYHQLAPNVPEAVFCMFSLMFAIITPALITGAFADRMKFTSMIVFMTLWHLFVYCPIAHSVWHPSGFLKSYGALDYAGGTVVHISSGVSGLVCSVFLGVRKGYGKESFEPYNVLLTVVGSAMIWVGWFGFNAGSAYGATNRAAMALLATQISAGTSTISWLITEWVVRKQPSVQGIVSGAIAGLVAITPASGYVDQTGAFFIGLLAGPLCLFGARIKHYFGYDDALDAFGIHAIGGIVGGILTGFFATSAVSGSPNGVFYTNTFNGGRQLGIQIYAIIFAVGWSLVFTLIIVLLVDSLLGLRVSESEEEAGLNASFHGETLVAARATVKTETNEKSYELSALHENGTDKGFAVAMHHKSGDDSKSHLAEAHTVPVNPSGV